MTREIRTPAEAVPHTDTIAEFQTRDGKKAKLILDLEPCFTAAECAQIARAYGEITRYTRKVHHVLATSEHGSKRQRRIFRLWKRCIIARSAWEDRFDSWLNRSAS